MRCDYTKGDRCWLKIMHGPGDECDDWCRMGGNDDDASKAAFR